MNKDFHSPVKLIKNDELESFILFFTEIFDLLSIDTLTKHSF